MMDITASQACCEAFCHDGDGHKIQLQYRRDCSDGSSPCYEAFIYARRQIHQTVPKVSTSALF